MRSWQTSARIYLRWVTKATSTVARIASFLGCENAVKLLLDHGANPKAMDPNGEMPLYLAVRDKNCAIAERLIKEGS
ncbi:hypothetical protein N7449_000978 [Penicillium cf. viridicatum]|uniref:Ankyrin repeat protein n=1 Tax=Penicillium cf. viridicatum TaxID=2972119 RepID=A0A9W9N5Y5_9EURO|nr:hypothetical protein N7449_000978 [Penicillium cf. viridicatum]